MEEPTAEPQGPDLVPANATDNDENSGSANEESEEEDEYEYEYEDDDDLGFSTTEQQPSSTNNTAIALADPKQKWHEPSETTVAMSVRAEQETNGGKRRLMQDLYRILQNQDKRDESSEDSPGFFMEPTVEDQMHQWTVRLFQFDQDSPLAKDLRVLGLDSVELSMTFPDDYPFAPPFVQVVRPRFQRMTGFVMGGALCMELLTKDGWNPVNDIESVIVSIRSLMIVGGGRLEAAANLPPSKYQALLDAADAAAAKQKENGKDSSPSTQDGSDSKRQRTGSLGADDDSKKNPPASVAASAAIAKSKMGAYSTTEAKDAYSYLSTFHEKEGWSSYWVKKG